MAGPWSYANKVQQHPQELSEFLEFVRGNAVKSYCEIGCKFGGLLWQVGRSLPKGATIVAVDMPNSGWGRPDSQQSLQECIEQLHKLGYETHLLFGDSTSAMIIDHVRALAPFDVIFIDANHTEPFVRKDFANFSHLARFCCLHDIGWRGPDLPGKLPIQVPKVWREIKDTFGGMAMFREIKHDNGHNGIEIVQWHGGDWKAVQEWR